MIVNQTKQPPFDGTYKLPAINLDPEKKIKPRDNGETYGWKNGFTLFCFFNLAISLCVLLKNHLSITTDPQSYEIPKSCPQKENRIFGRNEQFRNLYDLNFLFDFHAFLGESATNIDHKSLLIWTKQNLTYGDLQSIFSFSTNVSISEVG